MGEPFEQALLQKLYSLEKLSLRLLDKIQRTETESLKLLGEIHSRINELEREVEQKCIQRKEEVVDKIDGLRELLYTSEGDASKTRETFSMSLSDRFKNIYDKIDEIFDEIGERTTRLAVLETNVNNHLRQENSRFGRIATTISIIISLAALAGMIVLGIIQAIAKSS